MPNPATVTYSELCKNLSADRLAAYSIDTDHDSVDAVARYKWNMALGAAITPTLHLLEVAFRNALYEVGCSTTAGRVKATNHVRCWLDASPSFLAAGEERAVAEAIRHLGASRRKAGHLVAQLTFGFWVRLCHRPYAHGRLSGARLWPAALSRFPGCPRRYRNQNDISDAFGKMRDFRNSVAHHQPVWDRKPVEVHERALELLSWLSQDLANVADQLSTVRTVYDSGPSAYRAASEAILHI